MNLPSSSQHSFARVPKAEIQRSSFDRSHGYKTTFDAGYLVPVFVDEALPGDTFNLSMSAFARLATPLKPVMDNMYLDSFFFAVPIRLIWENWEKFNGAQANPDDDTNFQVPEIDMPDTGVAVGSLSDYFGMPTGLTETYSVSAFWHRAYNLVWNEWFRDQNLQDSAAIHVDDGPDPYVDYELLRRGKRHDYFTSCLPWPQKGDAVTIPLGLTADIVGTGDLSIPGTQVEFSDALGGGGTTNNLFAASTAGGVPPFVVYSDQGAANPAPDTAVFGFAAGQDIPFSDVADGLSADLTGATATTINALRQAFQIQRLLERDARGGTRYTEILKAHFGVTSPDARLQRPEFLGGGSSPVNIHPIAQTSEEGTTPQGNLAAFGTVSVRGHSFTKSFTEHCILLGLVSVRADLTYQQGLNRMFFRRNRFDFYWPALSHLGEQTVFNKEIYLQGADVINPGTGIAYDEEVFGYQERYAEYRYKPSMITGQFRSTFAQSLDVWHLSQEFGALPQLTPEFIVENPPVDRVIAVPAEPHFLFDSYFSLKCARPMPMFGVPGLIDHF